MPLGKVRLSADTGGTFTDILLLDADGQLFARKVSSSTESDSRALRDGISGVLEDTTATPGDVSEFPHATTVATNAVLERSGAQTALLTTEGFCDVLEIGRIRLPELYNPLYVKPKPLVERCLRLPVPERMGSEGQILKPLNEDAVIDQLKAMRGEGVEAVAIALLNSWINPEHEQRILELVRSHFPEAFACASYTISPKIGEFERTSTAVVNAYVGPVVKQYADAIYHILETLGMTPSMSAMQSSGGLVSTKVALDRPVHLLESGPAAGVVGAHAVATGANMDDCIAFDMGGTTAKASLIEGGSVHQSTEFEVGGGLSHGSGMLGQGGYPLSIEAIDIAEVGAGGGSIVTVDEGGSINVGPESAGALPGPSCYGLGGTKATVTDANVVLGYIDPNRIAGGAIQIDHNRAVEAIRRDVAEPLGIDVVEAAWAVHQVANASMISAIKAVTVRRGRDPRDFALLPFGGSGPVHAAEIARLLEITRILIPPHSGLLSAVGLLIADHKSLKTRGIYLPLPDLDPQTVGSLFEEEEATLATELLGSSHSDALTFERYVDVRYLGQGHEISIPLVHTDERMFDTLREDFNQAHKQEYGHAFDDRDIEIVSIRVSATTSRANTQAVLSALSQTTDGQDSKPHESRDAYFGEEWLETRLVTRADLRGGKHESPMILSEYDATIVIPPGCNVSVDSAANLIIEVT